MGARFCSNFPANELVTYFLDFKLPGPSGNLVTDYNDFPSLERWKFIWHKIQEWSDHHILIAKSGPIIELLGG
ncbi:MAG: hypothetical protein COB90_06430 [Hyphomicrobiales bacterium]|nr:MAG: hypothetical protein COB90_06430 [Hyphomicrobiales bacterium]